MSIWNSVTRLYFRNPHRINILRVHQPARFGDTINRLAALQAEAIHRLSHGVELVIASVR